MQTFVQNIANVQPIHMFSFFPAFLKMKAFCLSCFLKLFKTKKSYYKQTVQK